MQFGKQINEKHYFKGIVTAVYDCSEISLDTQTALEVRELMEREFARFVSGESSHFEFSARRGVNGKYKPTTVKQKIRIDKPLN